MLSAELQAEYLAFRRRHNAAPNPWSVPNAREQAGACLGDVSPLAVLASLAPDDLTIGWWRDVRDWVLTALAEQGQGTCRFCQGLSGRAVLIDGVCRPCRVSIGRLVRDARR